MFTLSCYSELCDQLNKITHFIDFISLHISKKMPIIASHESILDL